MSGYVLSVYEDQNIVKVQKRVKALRLVGCRDSRMWYAGKVGDLVELLREESDCYLSREDAGFTNIVHKADATLEDALCTIGQMSFSEFVQKTCDAWFGLEEQPPPARVRGVSLRSLFPISEKIKDALLQK